MIVINYLTIDLLSMKILYILFMVFLATNTVAGSLPSVSKVTPKTPTVTLKEALTAAYKMTFLTSAQYDVKGSYEVLSAAKRDGWLPKVGLSSSYTADFNRIHNKNNYGSATGNQQVHSAKNAVTLSQNIFAGGGSVASIRAQK
ncbi:MAG: hypothetical protein FJX18_06225, partial [Alphaproteobacteria bacterium]|nr:hypothetical protein [Alphaproteobacteria bacterium]